jgi:hypothetical protein
MKTGRTLRAGKEAGIYRPAAIEALPLSDCGPWRDRPAPPLPEVGGERRLIDVSNSLSNGLGVATRIVGGLGVRAAQRARTAHLIGDQRNAVVQPYYIPRAVQIQILEADDGRVLESDRRRRICIRRTGERNDRHGGHSQKVINDSHFAPEEFVRATHLIEASISRRCTI